MSFRLNGFINCEAFSQKPYCYVPPILERNLAPLLKIIERFIVKICAVISIKFNGV